MIVEKFNRLKIIYQIMMTKILHIVKKKQKVKLIYYIIYKKNEYIYILTLNKILNTLYYNLKNFII